MPSLLLLLLLTGAAAMAVAGIGVNYGTVADNLPSPPDVAAFLSERTTITAVKLFAPDPALISAFATTPISLTITVPNSDVPSLAASAAAADWVRQKLAPFHPAVRIARLAVGNEVIATADKALIAHLLPAMKAIHAALQSAGMSGVEVCSPHSLGVLSSSEPPSSGRFRRGYDRVIFAPLLEFHRRTKSKFMVNPYPYFGFTSRTLDYALFKPNPGVHDAATGMNYTNMFDAQMDAVHSAMKRLGYGDVELAVGETGWPSVGDADQPAVSMENARLYNGNLVRHVESGKGTPLMPGRKFETFIFALFNEDLKPTTSERNFGLFRPDFSAVYDVGVVRHGQVSSLVNLLFTI